VGSENTGCTEGYCNVLGPVKSKNRWTWAAWGKHPTARDYFRAGSNLPLTKAFSQWVENGYQLLGEERIRTNDFSSWRFWIKGSDKEILACGIGKDSSDSLGRSYPLLIMGTGLLEGWQDHWELLPFALEKTWRRIEHLSVHRFASINRFEDEILSIYPPSAEWSEFALKIRGSEENDSSIRDGWMLLDTPSLQNDTFGRAEQTAYFVPLTGRSPDHPMTEICFLLFLLKMRLEDVPNAMFVGGLPEKSYLVVFTRPLASSDFVRLWSISDEGHFGLT